VSAAGLQSDRLVRSQGIIPKAKIIPFRGQYYKLKKTSEHLVKNLIYPVPDIRFPFLGVHFTRMINGGIEAGPNAVLSLSREGYRNQVNINDINDYLCHYGLWKFLVKYPRIVTYELFRSINKNEFCRSLQKLVPSIKTEDLEIGISGIRAQAIDSYGNLLDDFAFYEEEGIIHIINAPSPAATSALAIAEHVYNRLYKDIK